MTFQHKGIGSPTFFLQKLLNEIFKYKLQVSFYRIYLY